MTKKVILKGDHFGNYEGILPEKKGLKYTECDIDSDGGYRGAKRIIFSNQGQIYYPTIYLKQNVFLHNGIVKVLDYHVGYYLDFFKEVINIGKSKDKYVKGFLEEYTNNRCNREKELESLYGRSFTKTINENLSEIKLKKIIPDLRHQMIDWIHRNDCLQRIKIRIESFARIFHCPGYVIAVEGTDGSGKSYIINTITPILNEAFHKGIEYRHLRPHVLPDLGILTGKKREGTNVAVVSNPHAQKPSGLLNSLVRWGYYMIDYTFGYMRLVWPQIHTKSKVFIFDRYYYDYYIDPIRAHISLPNQIFRFGEFFVPKPDLILCLGGTPETIYARKPETSLDEVRRQTIALQNFCKKRSKAVWVDTTLDPSDSVSTAMKSILSVMSKRFDINELK